MLGVTTRAMLGQREGDDEARDGESENQDSPHASDYTKAFSKGKWLHEPFCASDVRRKALDPALDVARPELEIWGWGDADDGQGEVQWRGHPRTLPKDIVSRYNGVLFNPHPTHG